MIHKTYQNICRISHANIDSENSYLIRVRQENGLNIYYYIESYELLDKLSCCPLTFHTENYHYIKLSDIDMTLLEVSGDILKESLSELAAEDETNDIPWKIGNFAMHHNARMTTLSAQTVNNHGNSMHQATAEASREAYTENYLRTNNMTITDSPEFPAFLAELARNRRNTL